MTEPVPWPTVKRPLIAILHGIRPGEASEVRDRALASVRSHDHTLTEAAG
jgi:hypothetical protein